MLSPNQVRAQIAAIRKWTADSPVLGLQSPTRWQGPSEMEVDGVRYLLRAAETELEMRAVLAEPRPENTHVVIITGLDAGKVGEDLLAQFARRRFYSLSATEILRELFQAHEIDPRLQQLKWLATSLADVRPESGYPPAPQGGLDQETAWGCYLDRILNLRPARPDLVAVLTWARDPTNAVRWREQDNDAKPVAARWLEPSVGAALECVLAAQAISSNETVTSLGLVAGVLFDRTDVPIDVATARGKFERYFGDRHIDAAQGKALAVATRQWIDLPDVQTSLARVDIERADALLRELRIEGRAIESDVSLIGFEQRLAAYGRALRAFLHKPTADAAETLAQLNRNIASHRSSKESQDRVERAAMALRLCRWVLSTAAPSEAGDFGRLAADYVNEGSFVDWARQLIFHGDSQPDLNQAFAELVEIVGQKRESSNRAFAEALANWTELGSSNDELIVIEDVLEKRLAAVAVHHRALFLVLDGMSYPVYRQLMAALVKGGWNEAIPAKTTKPIPVVAGLPTITEWSRRLLLSGRADVKPGEDEMAAFRDAPALASVTRISHPPILFLKGDLTEPSARFLSETVRKEIASPQRQVVGVVINAVDDHLTKDDQLHVAWSPAKIPLLEQVLDLARDTGRIVVLTSDHGHVIVHNSRLLRSGSSDRFRGADGNLAPEELYLSKGRAAGYGKGGFVAPWSERVYYTTRRNGFHGGLTPQEVLVPATVLVTGDEIPDGWDLRGQTAPDWWWDAPQMVPTAAEAPVVSPRKSKRAAAALETLPLFAPEGDRKTVWIDALFASPVYLDQYQKSGRTPPPPETVRRVLIALDERNGTLLKAALAQRTGEPEFRINGLLAILRRILNVEGYQVLNIDETSGTVRLDRDLLRTQFDLQ
jgi:PglZ domain